MREVIAQSAYFGVVISLAAYGVGVVLQRKFKLAVFNPLLVGIILTTGAVLLLNVSYEEYNETAKYLSYLLTPATVALAVPLYQQQARLKKHVSAVHEGNL